MIRKLAKKMFYAIVAKDEKRIFSAAMDSEIVSFDVFDTLLKRDVSRPRDVFDLIEKRIMTQDGIECADFAVKRVEAERQVRLDHPERDITLEEIYEYFPVSHNFREKLMQIEFSMELSVSTPNIPMKRVYDACIRQGKKIFFISDMYLSEDNIRALLEKNGYTRGKLYVSSESGFTKHNGKLFQYVKQQEHIENERWIHIGDSVRSDYLMPRKSGLKSALISERLNHNSYVDRKIFRTNADYRRFNHFIDIRIERYEDPYEKIGYAVLGPLLYGFSKWLERSIPEDEMIVFLARDGAIIQKAFEIISNRPSIYFYVSRKAVRIPYISNLKDAKELSTSHGGMRKYTQREIANIYGLSEGEINEIFTSHHMDGNAIVQDKEAEQKVLDIIWPVVYGKSCQQYNNLQQYICQLGFQRKCAIVDIGWEGTIQALLSKCKFVSMENEEISWNGYYYGEFEGNSSRLYEGLTRKNYLFERDRNTEIRDAIRYSRSFFEMLFLASQGTTKSYQMISDRIIEPVFGESDNNETAQRKEALHKAAIEFVHDIASSSIAAMSNIDAQTAAGNYLGLAKVPTLDTIKLFASFDYELERKFKFCATHNIGYYLLHINSFLDEFRDSPCKSWFLKSVFKMPLPYIQILGKLRNQIFK